MEPVVWVRRQYNDAEQQAAYRLSGISGWHLSSISGGRQEAANRAYWHAYVMCDGMLEGHVGHSCKHGPAPHRIKVCIVKKGNEKAWAQITQAAELSRTGDLILMICHKSFRDRSKAGEIVDCIAKGKFSHHAIGERRLGQYRRVPFDEVKQAWQSLVAPLNLSAVGQNCAQSIFDDEISAMQRVR